MSLTNQLLVTVQRLIPVLLLLLASCTATEDKTEYQDIAPVPPSFLSLDIDFPVTELEAALEHKVNTVLIDKEIPLDKKEDRLDLTISRYRRIDLAVRKNKIYLSVPLEIRAVIYKKVLGIRMNNEKQPVQFKAVAHLSTTASLDEDWQLEMNCTWEGLKWEKEPRFRLLGLNLNLTGIIESQLQNHQQELEDLLCKEISDQINFRKAIENLYQDLQKPQVIARKPGMLYLYTRPTSLNGTLNLSKRDTISLHAEYNTSIHISPDATSPEKLNPLLGRSDVISSANRLSAFVEFKLSIAALNQVLKDQLVGKSFQYEGYSGNIQSIDVQSGKKGIIMEVGFEGDLSGKVGLKGIPSLDQDLNLVLKNADYEIIEADQWVALTDRAIHQAARNYLAEALNTSLVEFFYSVDQKAIKGVKRSKNLGEKIDLLLSLEAFSPYHQGWNKEELQFIIRVEGNASLILKRGLLNK
jgi:hypothetical protein